VSDDNEGGGKTRGGQAVPITLSGPWGRGLDASSRENNEEVRDLGKKKRRRSQQLRAIFSFRSRGNEMRERRKKVSSVCEIAGLKKRRGGPEKGELKLRSRGPPAV